MGLQIEEQRNLIEKFVKANVKFLGNEDLFEDFCSEAFQKCYIVFNSSSSVQKIESYVKKVVNTSIIGVLKDSGRLKRTSSGYVRTRELSLDEIKPSVTKTVTPVFPAANPVKPAVITEIPENSDIIQTKNNTVNEEPAINDTPEETKNLDDVIRDMPSFNTKVLPLNYTYEIEDPKIGIEETVIKRDLLQRIADAVCVVHSDNPGKCYLEIYEARYVKEMKQKDIATLLNLSQSEVSKRLIELSRLIKFRIET